MEKGESSNQATMGGVFVSGPLGDIADRSDVLSAARIARGVPEMFHENEGYIKQPFGSPCLLHCEQPQEWSEHRNSQGVDASLMPLDSPTVRAFVPFRSIGRANKHWVGSRGDWIALVQNGARIYLFNVYTRMEIELPSIRNVGIHPDDPFRYHYNMMGLELLKIQISNEPYHYGGGVWIYSVIAVFDKLIAIMRGGDDLQWRILKNNYLAPSTYVDAIQDMNKIYVVTAPFGDVLLWEPLEYGASAAPRVIRAPVIQELGGRIHAHPNDLSVRRFLATGLGGKVFWVLIVGRPFAVDAPVNYMDRQLQAYGFVRCFVYAKDVGFGDPTVPEWVRQDNLEGTSLFVGMNYPFFLDAQEPAGKDDGVNAPVFRSDCVFASHSFCVQHPSPIPDWYRLPVNQSTAIGSTLFRGELGWGQFHEAPLWFVPTATVDDN